MKFFKKPFCFAVLYSAFLVILSLIFLLETFVIEQDYSSQAENYTARPIVYATESPSETNYPESDISSETATPGPTRPDDALITENSYEDENISIKIDEVRYEGTTLFVADIKLNSLEFLKTAMAYDRFGKNICEKTSELAERKGAILAINGDYYGAHSRGFVIKNGVLYRSKVRGDDQYDDLVIYNDGSFATVNEKEITAKYLVDTGAYQLFAFGPTLVKAGKIEVGEDDEVDRALSSNPRCAIGIIDKLHYVFLVSNGRTDTERGVTLYELAAYMRNLGCETAYNLDGGGSATIWFNGEVLNTPVSNGKTGVERSVSDIVYIGY